MTNEFKNALKVGYEQGNDQNILKETYIDVLNDACKVIDLALAGCVACIENQIDIIGAIQKANAESDSKGFDGVNGTMPGIVSVFQNNIKFLQYAPLKQGGVIFANTNSYIISFDSTMEKYIHIVRPDNIKLIQKFKNKV